MRKCLFGLAVLCLILTGSFAGAAPLLIEDFSGPNDWVGDKDPDLNSSIQWIYNSDGWQIVDLNGNNVYQDTTSSAAANMRGSAWINDPAVTNLTDFHLEADVYNLAQEVGFLFRGIDVGGVANDSIGFYIHEWGFEGLGAIYFSWFNHTSNPEGWQVKGYQNWTPQGAYPHGVNKIHVSLDVMGQNMRGQAWAYDGSGALAATADTGIVTFTSPDALRPGLIGIGSYSTGHGFDNIVISEIPEPGSIMALSMGLGLGFAALSIITTSHIEGGI
ncbi:MAG: hypothetical protein HYX78_08695 [Armatimonadetes bacterium]|nr:hypothetical protein [Armatimonadota bacterium]